jgi:RNA polymerase sigma factor (sigma-70 family)
MTDGQLLECYLAHREEAAFEALVRRHGPMVLGVCHRVLQNSDDAEDAFQATFLVLVRKMMSFRERATVGNWLYGVAYHTALKARAVAAKRRAKERQVGVQPRRESLTKDNLEDLQALLDQQLNRLADKHREAVVLCDLEGKTRREAARQLGIPEGTLSGRLTTARRLVAVRLTRHGLPLSLGILAVALPAASACVSDSLVDVTVRTAALRAAGQAGVGVITANVAALARGVLQTMLLSRIKTVAVVLLVVGAVGLGIGMLTQKRLFAQKPAVEKHIAPTVPVAKQEARQNNKPVEFAELYALPDKEVLKRVAPPFAPVRLEYYRREHAGQAQAIPSGPTSMFFRWHDGKLTNWGMHFGGDEGTDLSSLLRLVAGVYPQEIEGDQELVKKLISGDFIVREKVEVAKIVGRLQEILRRECKLPVSLTFREVERKAIVARGKYQFKPLAGRQENHVDIYGKQLVENSGAGGGSGDFREFLDWVGMFIDRRVVGDVQNPPKGTLVWHYHRRSPFTEQERKEDTDPDLVLSHLTEQTGLTFKEEKRPTRVLFVEQTKDPGD